MAHENYRWINSAIWDDEWHRHIGIVGRTLFDYLLTSPLSNGEGIYKISMPRIAFDTGIDEEEQKKVFAKFAADGKAFLEIYDGTSYVILKNYLKNQRYNLNGWKAAVNNLNALPKALQQQLIDPKLPMYLRFEMIPNAPITIRNDKEPYFTITSDTPTSTSTSTKTKTHTVTDTAARPKRARRQIGGR